jgi:tetratricopeptide (TPR) repeat protein
VILAKARGVRSPRPASLAPARPAPAWRSLVLPALGLALLVVAAALHLRRAPGTGPASAPPADAEPAAPRERPLAPPPPAAPDLPAVEVEVPDAALRAAPAANADQETADRLSARLRARAPLTPEDVRTAEDLFARYPVPARDLLESVLLSAASGHREGRRYAEAASLLDRARTVAPASPRVPRALLALRLETGDWAAAEAAAREALALAPADAEAARGLAYALVRQDRSREAIELLAAFVDAQPDPETRAFLDRIRRDQGSEASLDEARLAHFHVRYDGEAHEDVGREILRVLDRHYATLARTFDYEPPSPIPVVLLSRESYYDATGAPVWSGGQYDSFDGRVRLPIGGLAASRASELDETLLHELTHAFVADLSRGLAPREIQEGLAQLMEGKRAESLLGEGGLRALADGRLGGVRGFYASALALVEDLVAQRGQGGINELLRAMAETGSSDEGFRRVYGKDLAGLRRDWATRFRQRHGS